MFIEDQFELSELCMGIRPINFVMPTDEKIYPLSHTDETGKISFSARTGNTIATGETESEAVKAVLKKQAEITR